MTKPPHPVISPAALAEIYAHAARDYPKECCGIVFGPKAEPAVADRARACRNIQDQLHAEDPATHPRDAATAYNLAMADLRLVDRGLDADTPARIIYHSHVDVGAYFSATDQQAALFGDEPAYPVEYLVVDAQKDGARAGKQFAWDDERKEFVEVRAYP
jgi:proteasome lid subunit RPN8/RPN11